MKIASNGIKTEIDFEGATLPDGRSIEGILSENEKFKKDIGNLEKEVKDRSSILTLIPYKSLRIVVELILILGTIWGIFKLFK